MKILVILMAVLFMPVNAFAGEAVCQVLKNHKPRADVAHQGNADMNGTNILPEIIKVPLSVDLAQRVANLQGSGVQMEAPLGMVEVHQDGSLKYNGEDWTSSVKTLCGISHTEVTESVIEAPILNKKPILNKVKIINTKPVNPPKMPDVSKPTTPSIEVSVPTAPEVVAKPSLPKVSTKVNGLDEGDALKLAPSGPQIVKEKGFVNDMKERVMIEIAPTKAVPPSDVISTKGTSVKIKAPQESDIIQGGDYREIYYND